MIKKKKKIPTCKQTNREATGVTICLRYFFMGPTSVQTKVKLNKLDLIGSSRMCIYNKYESE